MKMTCFSTTQFEFVMMNPFRLAASILAAVSIVAIQEIGVPSVPELPILSSAFKGKAAVAAPLKLRYQLPKTRKITSTQGAGSRTGDEASIELLVPKDHVALTTSGHPTFFWYFASVPAMPVEFALYQQGVAAPIVVKRIEVKQAGIVKLEMPQNLPALTIDAAKYRWSVSLILHEDQRSTNPTYQAWIQRVQPTSEESKQLQSAPSDRDRASLYAQSGLWYDALSTIATPYVNQPNNPTLQADLTMLLDQVGLAKTINLKR